MTDCQVACCNIEAIVAHVFNQIVRHNEIVAGNPSRIANIIEMV